MSRILLLAVSFLLVPITVASAQQGTIFYTGQLDGFAGSVAICSAANNCSTLVQQVAQDIRTERGKFRGSILIGMGDNFAPDPGANLPAQMATGQRTSPNFTATPFRVMNFLSLSRYDAVVPGVQDFYFGAEFVRRSQDVINIIATNVVRNPMQPSGCPSYPALPSVSILLPNQISSSIASGSSSGAAGSGSSGGKGKGKKGAGGSSSASTGTSSATSAPSGGGGGSAGCLQSGAAEVHKAPRLAAPKLRWPDGNSIYPWSSEFALEQSVPTVFICPAEGPHPAPWLDPSSCLAINRTTSPGNPRYELDPINLGIVANGTVLPAVPSATIRLLAGITLRLCAIDPTLPASEVNHSCSELKILDPMFRSVWIAPQNTNYVILGALAPDTLNGLSTIDTSWFEKAHSPNVARQVSVSDPTSAILQALRAFDRLNSPRTGVLLAQMTPAESKALADSLGEALIRYQSRGGASRIEMIFSAADFAESTPHLTVDIDSPAQTTTPPQEPYYIPVITPSPVFQRRDCLSTGSVACLATVTPTPQPAIVASTMTVRLENQPSRLPATSGAVAVSMPSSSPLCADLGPASAPVRIWQCRVLSAMVQDTSAIPSLGNSADIAILEETDFDFSRTTSVASINQANPPLPTQSQTQEVLWKAGRLTRVSLLGSSIESLLQQNDKSQSHNFQVLPSTQSTKQLVVLGVKKIGDNTFSINGMPLSESRVYSVATTDRLANATSDFPQLFQTDLDNPALFPVRGATVLIADIAPRNPAAQVATLFGPSDLEGPEPQPAAKSSSPLPKLPSYTYSNRTLNSFLPGVELDRQFRPMVRLILAQTAVSYSSATPNQSDSNIGANFGGVNNPNVNAAYSSSVSVLQNARAEWYPRTRFIRLEDVGLDYLLNFAESIQGSLVPPSTTSPTTTTTHGLVPERTKSLTGNNITLSPFAEWQMHRIPVWKTVVVRLIGSNNVAHPLPQYLSGCTQGSISTFISNGQTIVSTCDANATKDDFQFSLRKTWTLGESIGTRLEKDDFRYFEFGYTHQRTHDVLSTVGVVNAGPNNVTLFCSLIGTQSLTACTGDLPATPNALLQSGYSNYSQDGGYVLGLWTVPLIKRVIFQGSVFGNFYAYGNDNQSSLTHYAFNTMATVLINLPANFSVGPTLNEFFFQANSTHTIGSSLIRRTVGAQFNYNFDWHTGVSPRAFSGNSQ